MFTGQRQREEKNDALCLSKKDSYMKFSTTMSEPKTPFHEHSLYF